jgi:hypothetical protein
MTDLRQAHDAARAIAVAALGHDPGPMSTVESSSHHIYASSDVVVKIIDAGGHSRLDREIALAPHLPPRPHGPSARQRALPAGDARRSLRLLRPRAGGGSRHGMPGVDGVTARLLAEQAIQRLGGLHSWMPAGHAEQTLREPLDHGGFVSQAALFAEVENRPPRRA